ncbi:MAG: galactokinase [Flavobacteriaceae bacterium]|nr:galactokinase [Flavobacteriaceae bacterium]|tara:strand:+ start:29020 stop:30171 length:1152 start_codon:yes stop_codon:yes gene_type:complete
MNSKLVTQVKHKFEENFNAKPIMVFAPGRINLIGEHTDYNEGFVFPAAVDKGIVMAVSKTTRASSTAIALDLNESYDFEMKNLQPLADGGWRNYIIGITAEIQKLGIQVPAYQCAFSGDIPNGAGMSSSAALENSLVFALNELFHFGLTKTQMIRISQLAEHNFAGVKCGIMDQYASMFGEENSALLLDCRTLKSKTFSIDFRDYQLLLINSNVKHELSESAYNDRRAVCEKVCKDLHIKALRDASLEMLTSHKEQMSPTDFEKVSYVVEENHRVLRFSEAIENDDLKALGQLIYDSHEGLSTKYQVSCKELDFLVNQTKGNNKILGARMMGGGFGGCTINIIHKDAIDSFSKEIQKKFKKEFDYDCSVYRVRLEKGTRLIEV